MKSAHPCVDHLPKLGLSVYLRLLGSRRHHQSPYKCPTTRSPVAHFGEKRCLPASSAGMSSCWRVPRGTWWARHRKGDGLAASLCCSIGTAESRERMYLLRIHHTSRFHILLKTGFLPKCKNLREKRKKKKKQRSLDLPSPLSLALRTMMIYLMKGIMVRV